VTKGLFDAGNAITQNITRIKDGIAQYVQGYMAAGMTQEQAMNTQEVLALQAQGAQLQAAGQRLAAAGEELKQSGEILAPYANGMNLKSDQKGMGIAPIIGVDFKTGNFNFAAKYEFKTRMRMKNDSDLKEATVISATNKFVDGTSVPEDSPAQLAVGAQWEIRPNVRVNLGYHHFFDTDAHWYEHSEKLLDGGTNEYLAGAEWDITKKLQVSGGAQITRYSLTDAYMNDMSFVVNSWTFGLGVGYQVSDNVKINAAYFQTNYGDYNMDTPEQNMASLGLTIPAGKNSFTRTNRVLGLGVEFTF
jgi:long-subunit fatty acid transport protein